MRTIRIFRTENGSTETWLDVNEDGTVTYHRENSGATVLRKGLRPNDTNMSAEEAKAKWPVHSADIDRALAELVSTIT